MFTFCWRNPRNLLADGDGCHLMMNLFCELWQSLMYFHKDELTEVVFMNNTYRFKIKAIYLSIY